MLVDYKQVKHTKPKKNKSSELYYVFSNPKHSHFVITTVLILITSSMFTSQQFWFDIKTVINCSYGVRSLQMNFEHLVKGSESALFQLFHC